MLNKFLFLTTLIVLLSSSFTAAIEVDVGESQPVNEIYIVAPQGRLYRTKRQWDGFNNHFGASNANANSQSFNFSPQGFDASQAFSGSQSYDFGGHHLSVGYAGSYSANKDGASGSFAPTYSWT